MNKKIIFILILYIFSFSVQEVFSQKFEASVFKNKTITLLTDTVIDCSKNNFFTYTLLSDVHFTLSNFPVLQWIDVLVANTANFTVTWDTTISWENDFIPIQSGVGYIDIYRFIKIGNYIYGKQSKSFGYNEYTNPNLPSYTYYISSSDGDDNNTGRDSSDAFKTLDKLNTIALLPGNTVRFRGGDVIEGKYTSSVIFKDTSKIITFNSYGSGKAIVKANSDDDAVFDLYYNSILKYKFNNLIIQGNYDAYNQIDSTNRYGIYAENLDNRTTNIGDSNYFVIDSCEFSNISQRGVYLRVLSYYTRGYYRFTNSYYHNIGLDGILVYGIVYSDFNITNNRFINIYGRDNYNYSSAVDMSYCRQVLIDSNYVNSIGLYSKIGGTGLHVGFGKSITWRSNEVRNILIKTNEGGALYSDVGGDSCLFEYNIVQNCPAGIVLGNSYSLLVPPPSYYGLMPGLVEDSLGASYNIARFNILLLDSTDIMGVGLFGYIPEKNNLGKLNFIYNNLIYMKSGFRYNDTAVGRYFGSGVHLIGFTDSTFVYNNTIITDSATYITTDTNAGSNYNGLTKHLVVHNNNYWNVEGDSTQYPMAMRVTYKYNTYPNFHFYYRYYSSIMNWADSTGWEKNGSTYTYFFKNPDIKNMDSRIYGTYAEYKKLDTLTNFQTLGTSIAINNGTNYNYLIKTFADTATYDFYGNIYDNDIGITEVQQIAYAGFGYNFGLNYGIGF